MPASVADCDACSVRFRPTIRQRPAIIASVSTSLIVALDVGGLIARFLLAAYKQLAARGSQSSFLRGKWTQSGHASWRTVFPAGFGLKT